MELEAAGGFEPPNNGFAIRDRAESDLDEATTYDGRDGSVSSNVSSQMQEDPQLAALVAAWPTLPVHIREAVRALVHSATHNP